MELQIKVIHWSSRQLRIYVTFSRKMGFFQFYPQKLCSDSRLFGNIYSLCPSLVQSKIGKITGQRIATFLYVIFAVFLLTVDEFLIGLAMYKSQRGLQKLTLEKGIR